MILKMIIVAYILVLVIITLQVGIVLLQSKRIATFKDTIEHNEKTEGLYEKAHNSLKRYAEALERSGKK